ncbi:uncharacterized protein LOC132614503 [Lycium barbarum]|uniref:uncharacterized protein LOC132614503 n=1 Tax=Lycium barbarum TaxID=112863 RepID=UPI00293E3165|nr:uncharacterized protein LOC132614503 [Lycium barbarum]
MPERVLRQFGHTRSIPPDVRHELRHYQREDRAVVDDDFLAFMDVQLHRWENRLGTLAVVGHLTPIEHYMRWYHQITRRLIGNPTLRPPRDVGYSALAGQYEALLVAVQRLRILGLEHMPYPGLVGLAAEMVRISEDGIRQAGEIRRMAEPVPGAEYQAAPGAPRGGGRAAGGRRARRGCRVAARGPSGWGLVDEADEADPIPEGVHSLVHPQPFQAGGSSPGDSPTFSLALLLAEIPGSSSQPSQNAYMEERDNVDWAALRTSLADERPVRNLEGARILDFDEFLIPDSAPAGPPEPPIQAFSHGPAEPAMSSHVTVEPHDSAPVGPQELPIPEHSHQPAEAEVSSHETTEAHHVVQETSSYSPPHPSQEPTDPSQEPTQAPVDTQVRPSAPAVATPDEEEVEFPDPA